jgi:molecular chaperone GrpE
MSEQTPPDGFERLLGRFDFTLQLTEIEQQHRSAIRAILIPFIEVMDSFDRLLGDIQDTDSPLPDPMNTNTVRLIARQLQNALRNAGVTRIECLNTAYDPHKHLAADVKDVPGIADETIVQEISKGYEWDGEILRLPHVIVANAKPQGEKEQ